MKIKNLFLSGLMCCTFVACSNNDEPAVDNGNEESNKVAFLQVNIASSNTSSRAGSDNGFEYGLTTAENKINTADFYFYNKSGAYFTKKTLTNLEGTNHSENPNGNVEYLANPILVLENVADGNKPTWMIVVINGNTTNSINLDNKSMTEAISMITNAEIAGTNAFVMTSSTYLNNNLGNNIAVNVSNSFIEEEGNSGDYTTISNENKEILQKEAVDVYVERLAVKTRLSFESSISTSDVIELANAPALNTDNSNADKTKVYAKILGWGLNGTQKESYILKNIDSSWNFNENNWNSNVGWNDNNNHRSYWAKSPNYASSTASYPTDFDTAEKTNKENIPNVAASSNYTLDYISWDEATANIATNLYCKENTNDVSENGFGDNHLAKATSVLLKAQLSDASGNPLSYYKWSGILYTTEEAIKNALLTSAAFNFYYDDDNELTEETERSGIQASDLEFVNAYDGKVHLALTSEAQKKTWYKGESAEIPTPATGNNSITAEIEKWFEELDKANPCEFYNAGMMYYNIPIEHLAKEETTIGYYGVVRNHIYEITITGIKNIGKAVYEAKEDIIPTEKDLKLYYLSAEINVLSWKHIKQTTEL